MSEWEEKYKDKFELNEKMLVFIDEVWKEYESQLKLKTAMDSVIYFCLGKSYKTLQAILILCRSGYGEDASVLLRSLLNLTINTLYIASRKDPEQCARRFLAYDVIAKEQLFLYLKNRKINGLSDYLFEEKFKAEQENMERMAKDIKREFSFKFGKGWADTSIAQMAKKVGMEFEYKLIYVLLSDIEHSNSGNMTDYIHEQDYGFSMEIHPSENRIELVVSTCISIMIRIINQWNTHFKLSKDEEISKLLEKYRSIVPHISTK